MFKNKKAQIIQNKKSGSHSVICGLRLVLLILHCSYTQSSLSPAYLFLTNCPKTLFKWKFSL